MHPVYSEKDLGILREQLGAMVRFMQETVDPARPHRDSFWWAGNVPYYIDRYDPYEWDKVNTPIEHIWGEYLYELKKAGLTEKLEAAKELPIADLLACSDVYTIYD